MQNHPRLHLLLAALICFALGLACRFTTPEVPALDSTTRATGGCSAGNSPFLVTDPAVRVASISYCAGGDTFTGQSTLEIPSGVLRHYEVVAAGYVDGSHVAISLLGPDGASLPATFPDMPKERWQPLDVEIPAHWRDQHLKVLLTDAGIGHTQWGGVGLRIPEPARRAWVTPLFFMALLLSFLASVPAGQPKTLPAFDISRRLGESRTRWVQIAIIVPATVALLAFRRPDQFVAPYIWVEDGTVSLKQYIEHGWMSLIDPVAGYLILPSKIIHLTAFSISATHYPEISNWLNVIFHILVLCAIAFSPTTLRLPFFCAIATLLLPTDSEVFGTSHYAFWWGSLLLLPPLLWREDRNESLWPRLAMTTFGALSSPLVITLLPLFALRSLLRRTRNDHIVLAVAMSCAVVQASFLTTSGTHGTSLPQTLDVAQVVQKFLGMFVYNRNGASSMLQLYLGAGLLALLVAGAITARGRLGWVHFALLAAMAASVVISVMRAPLEIIDPINSGPRYFFYPYIFLCWIILQLIPIVPRRIAVVLIVVVLFSLTQFLSFGTRRHDHLDWPANLERCARQPGAAPVEVPIHFDGSASLWHARLKPAECRTLRERSLLD